MPAANHDTVDKLSAKLHNAARVSDDGEVRSNLADPLASLPKCSFPYRIKHRILTQVQVWLEQACFDYAKQNTPEVLATLVGNLRRRSN